MANSILIPCSVSAKSVRQPVPVSTLASQPFVKDTVLETGIHVHWALPDALTSAKIDGPTAACQALFPGVPDLWLVVRFNPPGTSDTTRKWIAWVIDSRAATATPLASWQPPTGPDTSHIFTAAGLLPVSGLANYPGWGALPNTAAYDPAQAAYYPSARNKFGFYDSLADIAVGPGVEVSYTVIGWYSLPGCDPIASSANPADLLSQWNLDWEPTMVRVSPAVSIGAVPGAPAWIPPSLNVSSPAAGMPPAVPSAIPSALRARSTAVKNSLGFASAAANNISALDASVLLNSFEPSGIVCHGSVFGVATDPGTVALPALPLSQIQTHPSIKRAMAAISNATANAQQLDYAEMMLQNLDSQTGTTAGVLDLPGAAQSLSFQGVPGKSTFFAKIQIGPAVVLTPLKPAFTMLSAAEESGTGHWPAIAVRSAAELTPQPAAVEAIMRPPVGRSESAAWIQQLLAALATTVSQATVLVDSRFIYVLDRRSPQTGTGAQPPALGVNPDGAGSDGAGWWLDSTDTHALGLLYSGTVGASVSFPSAGDLHQVPGPRWYRPWSPHIVLTGAGRSFRFGCDGRFNANGNLQCRLSGDTVSSVSINAGAPIAGSALLDNPGGLKSVSGPLPDCALLLQEAVLLDVTSAPVLARLNKQPAGLCAAAQTAIYISRDASKVSGAIQTALQSITARGTLPSPVALTSWLDPFDPLFLDAKYTYLDSPIAGNWQLQDDWVELTPAPGATPAGTSGSSQFSERTRVTAALANVLKSSLVTGQTLDPNGQSIPANTPPLGANQQPLTSAQFDQLNVISAPLVQCDELLAAAGYRERSGELRVDQIDLVDVFGIAHSYPSAGDPVPSPVTTSLTPRLPYWSRLKFRLQSAADPTTEADRAHSPVCGLLVPDYIDHAMDVFDSTGTALGQIVSDPPQTTAGGGTLTVNFIPLPWLAPAGGDPTAVIGNPTLRSFVQALEAQSLAIPESAPSGTVWYETGLSAMMRIVDTVRGTLDPQAKTQDRRVKLIGEPIVVLPARVAIEATLATDPGVLAGDPPPLAVPPATPAVPFRIGDITRPDDGVLGIFDAARGKFAPVSMDAANNAILSGLTQPLIYTGPATLPVTHPFIEPQQNAVSPGGAPVDVVILADARGAYYATCGVLPRKKIVMPAEFLQPVIGNIEPVIQAGPVVTLDGVNGVQPVLVPPQIEGMTGEFICDVSDPAAPAGSYPALPLPPALPLADLPTGRITLDSGWIRIEPVSSGAAPNSAAQ